MRTSLEEENCDVEQNVEKNDPGVDPSLVDGRDLFHWYCQLKPNLAPSTRGAGNLIPDKSMDYSQVNGLFSVQFSLS